MRGTITTLFWTPDASSIFGFGGHFVHSVVAPLFILGIGALLNLDRLIGWCLLTLLVCTLLVAGAFSPVAPYWPLLLPLLPVVGITVVFALDRMAALWTLASNEAGSTAATSLAGGLLIAVFVLAWVSYYTALFAVENDGASYTGRALATLSPAAVAVLVSSTPDAAVRLDDPVVQYAAGPRVNQALAVGPDALPATLPPESQVIVQGSNRTALAAAGMTAIRRRPWHRARPASKSTLFVLHMP